MSDRPMRTVQRSIRLSPEEAHRYDQLTGYRSLWGFSELARAGLELLHQAEQNEFEKGNAQTGARRRRAAKKGTTA